MLYINIVTRLKFWTLNTNGQGKRRTVCGKIFELGKLSFSATLV